MGRGHAGVHCSGAYAQAQANAGGSICGIGVEAVFKADIGGSVGQMSERKSTTIRMPEKLKDMIAKKATEMGVSINAMLLIILQEYLHQQCR